MVAWQTRDLPGRGPRRHADCFVENWLGTSGGQKGVCPPPRSPSWGACDGAAQTLEGEELYDQKVVLETGSGIGELLKGLAFMVECFMIKIYSHVTWAVKKYI